MGTHWRRTILTTRSQMCCTQYKNKIRIGYTSNPMQRGIWRVKTKRDCMDQ